MSGSEINITLFHPPTSRTDAVSVPSSTTLADLTGFATALLELDGEGGVVLTRGQSRRPIHNPNNLAGGGGNDRTLSQCGVADGEFISVYRTSEFERVLAAASVTGGGGPARQRPRTAAPAAGRGGLDFSALLGVANPQPRPVTRSPIAPLGQMDFSELLSTGSAAANGVASAAGPSSAATGGQPVQWDGMNLDQAIASNPNPVNLMKVLSDTARHPNLMKELNYHNQQVCKRLAAANGDVSKMAEVWRQTMMKNTTSRYFQNHLEKAKEIEMRKKLQLDPMDAEANAYFGDKIRKENVQRQYEQMMEEYPESMGRVLMLYINCKVNDKPLQVFVDSGAQNTIMSSVCADRLGLLHMVDDRFAGVAVGVGTGKILGKIHMVELGIGCYSFPCSVTVMDSEAGLGDKNMDCLFGLDMLKRHRCCIDLAKNVLRFALGGTGGEMEAPFLHEKDLPTSKGGTMDFDAEEQNAKVEAQLEKMEMDEEEQGQDHKVDDRGKEKKGDGKSDRNDNGEIK